MSKRRAGVQALTPVDEGKNLPDLAERQRDTAEYLSEMILELRNLARTVKLHSVMVPLEFAYYEAFGAANRVEVPAAEVERLRNLSRISEELERDRG